VKHSTAMHIERREQTEFDNKRKECGLECTGHITSSEFQFAFVSDFTSIFLAMTGF
jgi:hypothetical protein